MNNPHMKMTLFQLAGKQHTEHIGLIPDPLNYMLDRHSIEGIHPVWLQNLIARTELVRRVGGFDTAFRYGDDDDFAFWLGRETKFCYVNMPMVVIDGRQSLSGTSGPARTGTTRIFACGWLKAAWKNGFG